MLTVDLKINGDLIGHMYIVNVSHLLEDSEYEYTIYDVAGRKCTTDFIEHKRSEGAWELVQRIINREKKKTKKKAKK